MKKTIVGWDVGGAHLKAAVLDQRGHIVSVLQKPCPLWRGVAALHQAVEEQLQELPAADLHAITMTGELVDSFSSREQGVQAIVSVMQDRLGPVPLCIYAGTAGFLQPEDINADQIMSIASANWLASATLAAQIAGQGLFVDIGSTTTDLLLLQDQQVVNIGYSDYERLVSGELFYTGVVRTSVMAVARSAQFNALQMNLMAEHFATMADVYRLNGDLNEAHDQSDTADGAEKSLLASARRLSRMTGYEFDVKDMALWHDFALHLKGIQKQQLKQACLRQLDGRDVAENIGLIGAGIGRFLLAEIATELQMPYRDFSQLLASGPLDSELDVADCAPAVAVAHLAGCLQTDV